MRIISTVKNILPLFPLLNRGFPVSTENKKRAADLLPVETETHNSLAQSLERQFF